MNKYHHLNGYLEQIGRSLADVFVQDVMRRGGFQRFTTTDRDVTFYFQNYDSCGQPWYNFSLTFTPEQIDDGIDAIIELGCVQRQQDLDYEHAEREQQRHQDAGAALRRLGLEHLHRGTPVYYGGVTYYI